MARLYLTIDTEYEFGFTARRGLNTRADNFDRSIMGRTSMGDAGIFYQMDVFDACGMKAVFFVDPMPALVWGTDAIADIVQPIVARGHGVQLHMHTEWLAIAGDANPLGNRVGGNIKDFSLEDQTRLLEWGIARIEAAGAPRPIAFRAGNYGANDDTLRALAALGLTHDSSHTPGMSDSASGISLGADDRAVARHKGVIEVPVGCVGDAVKGLRHAQLTALSFRELRAALRHAALHNEDFVLVSHSFELLSRSRRAINRIVQRRFERFCTEIAAMPEISATTFVQCPPQPRRAKRKRRPVPGSWALTGLRMAEQVVANTLYGRK